MCPEDDTAWGRVTAEGQRLGGAGQGHPPETRSSLLPLTPQCRCSRELCGAIAAIPETLTALLIKLLGSAVKGCRAATASRSDAHSPALRFREGY